MLSVSGMTCAHCAALVRAAIASCSEVTNVVVDLKTGLARVSGIGFDLGAVLSTIKKAGFAAAPAASASVKGCHCKG